MANRKQVVLSLVGAAIFTLCLEGRASAVVDLTAGRSALSGAACSANNPAQASCIWHDAMWGLHNACSYGVTVVCPVPEHQNWPWGQVIGESLTVEVYDRDPANNISCTFYKVLAGGGVDYRARSTSGYGSGMMTMDFGMDFIWTADGVANTLVCWIPAHNAANGDSHLVDYYTHQTVQWSQH